MNYDLDEIVRDVRVALDENEEINQILDDSTTLTLDDIIRQKILHAVRYVLDRAPLWKIDNAVSLCSAFDGYRRMNNPDYVCGVIELPEDFIRLKALKTVNGNLPVTEVSGETLYMQQKSPVPVFGTPSAPLCFLTEGSARELEYYSIYVGDSETPDEKIEYATYIAEPTVIDGVIDIPQRLYNEILYMAASMTAVTIKDTNAQNLMNYAIPQNQPQE